jgi:hypothetical protein
MRGGFVLLIFLTQTTLAQFNYVIDQSIPVALEEGTFLSMPWAGGLNATQFNTLDLNGDGNQDLAIFDRTADRVVTFLNDNNQYRYAPEYEIFFPSEISNWMLLRDYNGDGKKDIFTGDNLGIKVYKNITPAGEPLEWELFLFPTGIGNNKSTVLLTTGFSGKINLQLNSDDLPSVNDYDGDGDLDLFVPKYPGGATIEFHKNMSVENGEPLESLDFARTPQTPTAWGNVTECDCGVFAFNGDPCDGGGRIKHAGGKSLLSIDIDNDGDKDMLISESACSQLYLLLNTGTNAAPVISSATAFPAANPAAIVTYPTAFYEDVDFDGIKDLIATPNISSREFLQTNLKRSVWFYKNTGSTALPSFVTIPNRDFLQENMIDVGDNAAPAFFDADGDGDLDLFIGCFTTNFYASIYYFENVGTQLAPSFELITADVLASFGVSFLNLVNIKPFFADLNGDSKIDLAFTASDQFGTDNRLYFMPNQSGIGADFSDLIATDFTISSNSNVTVADVNLDGKNDLLVGKESGNLEYWKNTGSASNPDYTLENPAYLGLDLSVVRRSVSTATADLDMDGKTDLLFGDHTGNLTVVSDYRNANDVSGASTGIIYNTIQDESGNHNLGGRIWPTIANIFKADKPSIIVGNTQGGLHILKPDESIQFSEKPIIDVYPNPVSGESDTGVTIRMDRPGVMIMLTALGQEMGPAVALQTFQEYNLRVKGFSKGIYLLYFLVDGKTHTRKIVIN